MTTLLDALSLSAELASPSHGQEWSFRCECIRREIWQAATLAVDAGELLSKASASTRRHLPLTSVDIWQHDFDEDTWKLADALSASSSELAISRRSRTSESVGKSWQEFGELLKKVATTDRGAYCCAVAPLHRGDRVTGLLVTAADPESERNLEACTEMIADDLSQALGSVDRRNEDQRLARIARAGFQAPYSVICIRRNRVCSHWNPAASRLFGWPAEEVLGMPVPIVAPEDRDRFWQSFERVIDERVAVNETFHGQRWDGSELPIRASLIPVIDPRDGVNDVLLVITDDSTTNATQHHLRIQLNVSNVLATSSSLKGMGGRLLAAIAKELEWPRGELWQLSATGREWERTGVWNSGDDRTPGSAVDALEVKQAGLLDEVRTSHRNVWKRHRTAHGDLCSQPTVLHGLFDVGIPVMVDGDVTAVLVFPGIQDARQDRHLDETLRAVSEHVGQALACEVLTRTIEQKEAALRQSRKMEALGQLAGGISHDFNNLLTVIMGNIEFIESGLGTDSNLYQFAEEIKVAVERAASLTRRLLTFSRKRPADPGQLQLNDLLRDFEGMLQRVVGEKIAIEFQLAPDAHHVHMDPVEFEQMMLNLAANARDAMNGSGVLRVRTENRRMELVDLADCPGVDPGDFLTISVADNGCGMDEETRARIFEPFFTTKDIDKGTGLGLASLHGIVQRCRGFVTVSSEVGVGTEFRIHLPRSAFGIAPRKVDEEPGDDPRGTERILVVEDEEILRRLINSILNVHGYSVTVMDGGRKALEHLEQHGDEVDLLLTDVMMPEMTGTELLQHARRLRPDLPVLLMSGYAESLPAADDLPPVLNKPFSSDALSRAVRAALDREAVAS